MARLAGVVAREAADELALPSQKLVEAALRGDVGRVEEILKNVELVDVNYIGTVSLRVKCTEIVIREETADQVRTEYEEFKTDVTALFAAAHSGHHEIVRKLLSSGADVNQKLFLGYASSAAAREGHCGILGMLLKAGTSQSASEDALLEASLCGEAQAVELLICSDMPRPDAAAHALVTASCRGFVDVVTTLIQNGVDINCMDRVLLRSVKPALHANVDCSPLVAAIITRQVSIVKCLLKASANVDCQVRVGAWSWDTISGEELRVGACLGEPYSAAWCAVEYFEASGDILKLLLHHNPHLLENPHIGRSLLCHAILCQNPGAVNVLLNAGANTKFPLNTRSGNDSRPLHLAARLGSRPIIKLLISYGCDVNARTATGETAIMAAAKADNADCFLELLIAGADLGIASKSGDTALHFAKRSIFGSSIVDIISEALIAGADICSSDLRVFSPLHFAAASGNVELLQMIMQCFSADLDKPDGSGFTPAMIAVIAGYTESFRLLVMAGADLSVETPDGKTVMSILMSEGSPADRNSFEQILLNAILANVLSDCSVFKALHYAARCGDSPSAVQLLKMGFPVNSLDDNGYSPLMLAAKGGHIDVCKLLLFQGGADCGLITSRGETALSLARGGSRSSKAVEGLLLDHLARSHVLDGEELLKHTREGRGSPHMKVVRMLKSGVLTWGRSSRRNVVCKDAFVGPSLNFLKNQRKDGVDDKRMVFRVVTLTGRQVHFEAGSASNLELWVRGVNLIVKEAVSGA